MGDWLPALIGAIAVLLGGGGLVSWFLLAEQKKRESASTADILTGTAVKLVEEMKKQLDEIKTELATAKAHLDKVESENELLAQRLTKTEAELVQLRLVLSEWHLGIEKLTAQIEQAKLKPAWRPPKFPEAVGKTVT
jgi:septal ring factor EnvC (AmiA/AmiB activator)